MGDQPRHWRDVAIEYIRSGKVDFESMVEQVGYDLAVELFKAAGVDVPKGEKGRQWIALKNCKRRKR